MPDSEPKVQQFRILYRNGSILSSRSESEEIVSFSTNYDSSIGGSTLSSRSESEEVVSFPTNYDSSIGKDVILWEDILLAYKNATHIRDGALIIQFLKGNDLRSLEPLRIVAKQNAIYEIIVDDNSGNLVEQNIMSNKLTDAIDSEHVSSLLPILDLTTLDKNDQDMDINDVDQQSGKTNSNFVKSYYEIGLKFVQGILVSLDYTKATENYLFGAEQGDHRAQVKTGRFHIKGLGVPQDFSKAMES
ncbi:hypothetical protein BGZ76_005869, partial [Entomortierella beljakovae]